ncbi:MAG: restriction endonuclease [Pseudoxanthomonas sp.]
MPAWYFGFALALFVGLVATLYLWLVRRRQNESAAGLLALAGMRWREFSRLVLAAMELRGYRRPVVAEGDEPRAQDTTFLLDKGGSSLLVACKHGSAYRIGAATVDEIAADLRLRGAQGGVLVTEGSIDPSGREKAARHGIEVLTGPRLWAEIKPLLDHDLHTRVVGGATARAKRHTGIAWLAAIAIGAIGALLLSGLSEPAAQAPARAAAAAAPVAATTTPVGHPPATTTAAAAPRQAPARASAPASTTPPTEAELEKERVAVSRSLGSIDGLLRGIWISRSTLAVDRTASEERAWSLVCAELALHPNLALTRVQMNPPAGSNEPVRWRQCEAMPQ